MQSDAVILLRKGERYTHSFAKYRPHASDYNKAKLSSLADGTAALQVNFRDGKTAPGQAVSSDINDPPNDVKIKGETRVKYACAKVITVEDNEAKHADSLSNNPMEQPLRSSRSSYAWLLQQLNQNDDTASADLQFRQSNIATSVRSRNV